MTWQTTETKLSRALTYGYVAGAATCFLIVQCAYWNVSWHDPWRTPRWSPYFIFWWNVRDTFAPVAGVSVFAGIGLLLFSCDNRRQIAAILVALGLWFFTAAFCAMAI